MPVVSGKQYRFMAMCEHNPHASATCPDISVSKEFVHATPKLKRSKFSSSIRKRRKK